MSTWPVRMADTRVDGSGMALKTTVLTFGAPPQYVLLASSSTDSPFAHLTTRNGPVPIGFAAKC